MKTATKTAASNAIVTATAKTLDNESQVHVRNFETLVGVLDIREGGASVTLRKGSKLNAEEIVVLVSEYAHKASSASLTAANILRLAKTLPDTVYNGNRVSAYDFACMKVKESFATDSAWQNVKGLILAADIVDKNNLNVSPFAIKESLGYLNKLSLVDKETLKLSPAQDPVADALRAGISATGVKGVVSKAKEAKPDVFKASKASTTRTLPPEVVIGGEVMTPEKVMREIQSCIGLWNKAIMQKVSRDELRKTCEEKIADLAKLAGFRLVPLEK